MAPKATHAQFAFELGFVGPAFAGVLYRLRAEELSGVLVVQDVAISVIMAVARGRPLRCLDASLGSLATDAASWRSALVRGPTIKSGGEELARWCRLFACEEGTARLYSIELPSITPTLSEDWMHLVRLGLSVDSLDEAALRRRLSPLLGIRERLLLVEPIPSVLADFGAVEAAVAGRLREGTTVVDLLATAHRFGNTQIASVLRALYALSQLGLVRQAAIGDEPVAEVTNDAASLTQLNIVLAGPASRPDSAVLGNIFDISGVAAGPSALPRSVSTTVAPTVSEQSSRAATANVDPEARSVDASAGRASTPAVVPRRSARLTWALVAALALAVTGLWLAWTTTR